MYREAIEVGVTAVASKSSYAGMGTSLPGRLLSSEFTVIVRLLLSMLMLIALALPLAKCSSISPPIAPPSVQPDQRPQFPKEGRQSPIPLICSPTCSAMEIPQGGWRTVGLDGSVGYLD
uniref:holin n=1 Tax=unclassified Variovorax TaxID=663243 RepID=UPI0011B1CA7D